MPKQKLSTKHNQVRRWQPAETMKSENENFQLFATRFPTRSTLLSALFILIWYFFSLVLTLRRK